VRALPAPAGAPFSCLRLSGRRSARFEFASMTDGDVRICESDIRIQNDRTLVSALWERLESAIDACEYSEASKFALRIAYEEAVSNAFRHGHAGLPAETMVTVSYCIDPEVVEMTVEDQGPGFDPDSIPDPTLDENLAKPGGRGIMLIKAYMSEVKFDRGGRRLSMRYRRPPEG
jgi:serine/threonine-protein kinase RsbW